uniref:Cytochrome f, chloroplastic n=1 Tax=Euglena gracilis TaxID=3039 RepID=CYF_EUGGR|nr:RecName: Full=Cytochrome f, chloroplastic; Flags: Precursor [Euglena gracilis]
MASLQTPVMVGTVVGCVAGVVGFLAMSSNAATSLSVAPASTSTQIIANPSVIAPQYQGSVTSEDVAMEASQTDFAEVAEISSPVQVQSWSMIFSAMLAVPLAAAAMFFMKKSTTEERRPLVSIDDLLSVGKKAVVASAVVGAAAGSANAYPIFAQQAYGNPREATGRIVCANCHLASKPTEIEVPQAVLPDQVFEAVTKVPFSGPSGFFNVVDPSTVVGSVTFAGTQPVGFIQESGVPVSQALVDIATPGTPDTVFKATIKVPYDESLKQVAGNGRAAPLNVGAVLILPEGFRLAPPERIPEKMKEEINGLQFIQYSKDTPNILVVGPVPGKKYAEMTVALLSPDPRVDKKAEFGTLPIYVGGNRGRGQLYPTGEKSNNNIYNVEHSGKIADIQLNEKKRIYTVAVQQKDGEIINEDLPAGAELIVKVGDVVEAGQAISTNPNVGGFGQAESEIVLQNPGRVQAFLFFSFTVLATQTLLVVKKKQYEQVQLSEMNF